MGHLHLHVGDIDRALGFYRDVLGFELQANLGSAAFVSAGGYHHHLGVNVWKGRGVGPAPAHTAGLHRWTVQLPDVDAVRARVEAAGLAVEAAERRLRRPRPVGHRPSLHHHNPERKNPWTSPSSAPATWPAASRRARSPAARPSRCSAREAAKAEALAAELSGSVRTGTVGDPLTGDVVVLAVRYPALDDVLGSYGDQLDGKVVVDITNPVDFETFTAADRSTPARPPRRSRSKAPGAKVVKAFNTTFAGTLVEGEVAGQPLDVLARLRRRGRQGRRQPARRGRRPACDRRRPARARARARGARLPAHGAAAAARHRLRQRRQGPRVRVDLIEGSASS